MRPRSTRHIAARAAFLALLATLAACGGESPLHAGAPGRGSVVAVRLIGFNDFHGNLEPPRLAISAPAANSGSVAVPAGGAAYLASAIARLKAENPNHAVISAGDMIGASPLASALFLDEPTIDAFNLIGIDFNALGNHEFDKGWPELLRMQHGGCARHTALEPCRVNKEFAGAGFGFLAANTLRPDGGTLFPASAVKTFSSNGASVKVGFIGMTLKGTPAIVTPAGVAGLSFGDEAETANALVPALRAQGAQTIVVIVHEGGNTTGGYNDKSCPGLSGDIVPILERLDGSVDVVISGHTHRAYICDFGRTNPAKPFLLTSAGQYGTLLTSIDLRIDAATGRVVGKTADNVIVQGESFVSGGGATVAISAQHPVFPADPAIANLVARYAEAAAPLARRAVGKIAASITRNTTPALESALGNLIADAQLAATQSRAKGGAQIAFMNPGGMRADLNLAADGTLTYGQIFSVQPFGNSLVVKTFSGAQIRALLEQQFASGSNTLARPRVLATSRGFSYAYDLSRPPGARIIGMTLQGGPVSDTQRYRVAMNSFLASGGDNFTLFNQGGDALGGDQEIDALEAYLAAGRPVLPPATDRIRRIGP